MALNTTTGGGAQTSTGTPQTVGEGSTTAQSGSVQPGTATSLLNSSGGISLGNSSVTTVDLSGTQTTTTAQASTSAPTEPHQVNSAALGFCAILFVVAIIFFVFTSRSAKNTT